MEPETIAKRHFCTYCGKTFKIQYDLEAHIRKHTGEKLYNCPKCESTFAWKSNLGAHFKRVHGSGERSHICPTSGCGKRFKTAADLLRHQERHSKERPTHPCPSCSKVFTRKLTLNDHVKFKHDGADLPYICTICGKAFTCSSQLVCHTRSHSEEKPYACSQCTSTFSLKGNLNRHVAQIHPSAEMVTRSYPCSVSGCGKAFSHAAYLRAHEALHSAGRPVLSCPTCGRAYKSKMGLDYHQKSHQIELVKQYTCSICGLGFFDRSQLSSHVRSHTGEKPYVCSVCNKSYKKKSNRDEHEAWVHRGEKNFECKECSKKFASREGLAFHVESHRHDGERRVWMCSACGKEYKSPGAMRKHRDKHVGKAQV